MVLYVLAVTLAVELVPLSVPKTKAITKAISHLLTSKTCPFCFQKKLLLYHYDYVSNLFESTTNPDRSPLGKRFWSFIRSMRKDKVDISTSPMGERKLYTTANRRPNSYQNNSSQSLLKKTSKTSHLSNKPFQTSRSYILTPTGLLSH